MYPSILLLNFELISLFSVILVKVKVKNVAKFLISNLHVPVLVANLSQQGAESTLWHGPYFCTSLKRTLLGHELVFDWDPPSMVGFFL